MSVDVFKCIICYGLGEHQIAPSDILVDRSKGYCIYSRITMPLDVNDVPLSILGTTLNDINTILFIHELQH